MNFLRLPNLEIEVDLAIAPKQKQGIYLAFVIIGLLSFGSIRYQYQWLKILRPALVLCGAICGCKLLYDYRTPSKFEGQLSEFELEKLRIAEQKEAERRELEEERKQLYATQEAVQMQMQRLADEQINSFQSQYQQQAENYEQMLGQLHRQVQILSAPRIPRGIRRIDHVVREVINVMWEYEASCDYEDAQAVPGTDIIWLALREGITVSQVKKAIEQLPHRLRGVQQVPEVDFADGFVEISIGLDAKQQKAIASTDDKGNRVEIIPPPQGHLENLVKRSYMFWVNGGTGVGKSTLLDNLANLAAIALAEEESEAAQPIELFYIDPKFPDTDWQLRGQPVLPQYQGYELLSAAEADKYLDFHGTAQDGAIAMGKEVRLRLSTAAKARRQKKASPKRSLQIWIVDEAEDLVNYTPEQWEMEYDTAAANFPSGADDGKSLQKLIRGSIKSTYRLGRSTRIKCAVVGQSWLPSDYGFRITNLSNASQIYLGFRNAKEGIRVCTTIPEQRKFLNQQLAAYEQLAQADERYRYIGLFKLGTEPAYLAPLPPPNLYSCDRVILGIAGGEEKGEEFTFEGEEWGEEGEDIYDLVEKVRRGEGQPQQRLQPIPHPSSLVGNAQNTPNFSDLAIEGEEVRRVRHCLAEGMGIEATIKAIWGIPKGGGKNSKYGEKAAIVRLIRDKLG